MRVACGREHGLRTGLARTIDSLVGAAVDRAWRRLCVGPLEEGAAGWDAASWDTTSAGPLLSTLARLNQPATLQLLRWHAAWLECDVADLRPRQAQWIFALLVHLDRLLTADATDVLRTLARRAARLRAALGDPADPRLSSLNVIITIVAEYFEQYDLADRPRQPKSA